ncbi:MAG: hypothetical protein U9R36_01080, partial [Elusimicrobiota bacterium]|nr:hypothetical protein [Elusimicrobiota bacterium]
RRARRIVGENANIIIVAEKAAHLDYLIDLHEKFRVTVIAHGGQPSLLNNEYFVESIKKVTNLKKSFYIFSITDFDPPGRQIADTFVENLKFFGIKNIKLRDLIHPDSLTRREIEISRHRLTTDRRTKEWYEEEKKKNFKNMKYLKIKRKTGSGKRKKTVTEYYGLTSEAVTGERLDEKFKKYMLPLLGRAEDYLKEYELGNLEDEIRKLILFKMTGR